MGATSARCGCGGHPQKVFLNHCVYNSEWFENNKRLKDEIRRHNRIKRAEAAQVMEQTRAWASGANTRRSSKEAAHGQRGEASERDSTSDSLGNGALGVGWMSPSKGCTPMTDPVTGTSSGTPGTTTSDFGGKEGPWSEPCGGARWPPLVMQSPSPEAQDGSPMRARTAPVGARRARPPPSRERPDGRHQGGGGQAPGRGGGGAGEHSTGSQQLDAASWPSAVSSSGRNSVPLPQQSGRCSGVRGRSFKETTIVQRHENPPHYYSCSHAVYTSVRSLAPGSDDATLQDIP